MDQLKTTRPLMLLPLVLHDACTRHSPSCPTMKPAKPMLKGAATPAPAQREEDAHLDLTRPHPPLANCPMPSPLFPPARALPCLSSLHERCQASGRSEEQNAEGGVFFLSPSPLPSLASTTGRQRRIRQRQTMTGDALGHESPRPPRTALPRQKSELP